MIDHKTLAILLTLLSYKKLSLYELTIKTKFSIKEIKQIMFRLNDFLMFKGLPELKYSKGYYTFVKDLDLSDPLMMTLLNNEQLCLPQNERLTLIYLATFIKNDFMSNIHYQQILNVSKNTVLTDIKSLRKELKYFDIELTYSRAKGYRLEGETKTLYQLAVEKISKLLKNPIGVWALEYLFAKSNYPELYGLIEKQVLDFSQTTNMIPIENHLTEMIYSIIFIACSYKNGYRCLSIDNTEDLSNFHLLVYPILDVLEEQLALTQKFNVIDKTYFCLLFAGCFEGSNQQKNLFFDNLSMTIIKKMETISLLDFSDAEEFRQNLKKHLIPAYYRLRSGIPEYNSYTKQIKSEYPEIFQLVKQSLAPLQSKVDYHIPDDEIAYFVLHFGGYLQNGYHNIKQNYQAIIVCPNGISSSMIIKKYLEELFPQIQFQGVSSLNQIAHTPKGIYDLIFSTVNIESDIPTYLVSMVMSDEQLMELEHLVIKDFPNLSNEEGNLKYLLDIIHQHATITREKELKFALKKFLKEKDSRKDVRPMLKDLLYEDTYQYSDDELNWEEAIYLASNPLLESEKIKKSYQNAMIEKVKEFGPFINLGKGVAIPHARPEDGVNEVGMSILVLKNPIYLLDNPEQKINVLICIAAVDSETHLKALSQLTIILRDDEKVNQIKESMTYDDIKHIIAT